MDASAAQDLPAAPAEEAKKHNLPNPVIPLSGDDWEHVYEPAEDTFLFMDALQAELPDLRDSQPRIVLELGCGSGCVTAFLASHLKGAAFFASDINPHALQAAGKVFAANNVDVNLVGADLLSAWRAHGSIDVLLFNPPYVPTPSEEISSSWIARAWAGGARGREVVDRLFLHFHRYMAPGGRLYLVALDSNDPHEIAQLMAAKGFRTKVVKKRRAGIEFLLILKIWKPLPAPTPTSP